MAEAFHVRNGWMQGAVSAFMAMYCVGQLFYGPIGSRLGRKRALRIGMLLGAFGSFLTLVSGWIDSIDLLMISRVVTALGAGAGLTLTYTLVKDAYEGEKARRVMAFVSASFAIMPGLAMLIGGFLVTYISWQASFYFQMAYFLFAFFIVNLIPDIPFYSSEKGMMRTFLNPRLLAHGAMLGGVTWVVYIFVASAPVIAIHDLGISASEFGLINFLPQLGMATGTIMAGLLVTRLSGRRVMFLGNLGFTLGVLILDLFAFKFGLNIWVLFLTPTWIYFFIIWIYNNAVVRGSHGVPDKSHASAIMAFVNLFFATSGSFIISFFDHNLEVWMPLLFTLMVLFQWFLFWVTREAKPLA